MLKHASDRSPGNKKIAIATCCDAFTELLKILLISWRYEICDSARQDILLLAEEGCAEPVAGQSVVWLTRSKYQGADRLSMPLEIENLWQILEHRYHRPPRMHIRMDVDLDASVIVDQETMKVRLSSLSDMGCRFSFDRELVREQQISLALSFSGEILNIDSRVIYAHHLSAASDQNVRVGLLFRGITKDQRDTLRSCLILQYLEIVRSEMAPERFCKAIEKFNLPEFVCQKLGI